MVNKLNIVIFIILVIGLISVVATISYYFPIDEDGCKELIKIHKVYDNLTIEQKDYIFKECELD